ncbi:MAG: 2-oxo acid dehydrogenase subunit E2 [FCB group bacterium]|nr:2-oxo acid dehydrogenase subunit E2 [FCB group bacterium]
MDENKLNAPWRKMSMALYAPPNEGKIYGTMDIDVTSAEEFVRQSRANGKRITITHVVTAAIGRILKYDLPEVNVYIKRGHFVERDDVTVMVAVNMKNGREMGSIRIHDADQKTVFEIAEEIRSKAAATRQGEENSTMRNKYALGSIPWPFRRLTFVLLKWFTNTLGFQIPSLGLTHNAFGSILLSNIGSHGLNTGMAALFPGAKLPAVIIMGKSEERPVVRDGNIVIRTIMPFTATVDHRIMDGFHAGVMANRMKYYMSRPELLANPPESEPEE